MGIGERWAASSTQNIPSLLTVPITLHPLCTIVSLVSLTQRITMELTEKINLQELQHAVAHSIPPLTKELGSSAASGDAGYD